MHRDGRYGPCRSLSPPFVKQNDYKRCGRGCQVCGSNFVSSEDSLLPRLGSFRVAAGSMYTSDLAGNGLALTSPEIEVIRKTCVWEVNLAQAITAFEDEVVS